MGFNVELFLTAIPEYLICPLCHHVLKDPRQMCSSQHFACGECLSAYLAREDSPQIPCLHSDCYELFNHHVLLSSEFVRRALGTLEYVPCSSESTASNDLDHIFDYRVQCRMSECDWTGSYDQFENHVFKKKGTPQRSQSPQTRFSRSPLQDLDSYDLARRTATYRLDPLTQLPGFCIASFCNSTSVSISNQREAVEKMGLDTELFIGGDIPEYLMCPICLEVLEDPQQMCTSQHVACDACLSKYFGNDINQKKPCPVCRQFFSWQSLVSSQILERALMTLKVKCVNSGECSWTGAYKDCEDHSKKSCRFAKVPCEKCRVEVVVNKKEEHLRSSCGEIMINCPRGGAQCGSYLRKNGPDHNRICSNYECATSASLSSLFSNTAEIDY
ncbi:hypothetical protein JCM5353_006659 [Sporobolomyces roseus]